jgi:heat shock protein 4
VKGSKEVKSTDLKFEQKINTTLTEKEVSILVKEELEMLSHDRSITETNELKNNLESEIYEARNNLDEKFNEFFTKEEKERIRVELDKMKDWIYGDGAKSTKEAYSKKREEIKNMLKIATQNFKEWEKYSSTLQTSKETVQKAIEILQVSYLF